MPPAGPAEAHAEGLWRRRRRRYNGWDSCQRWNVRRVASADDSNSTKVHRREGCLATVQTDKSGNIYSAPLHICHVTRLQLRRRRGAAGNGVGTTTKFLLRTTSGAAGNGLGATAKYLRRTMSGAAGIGLTARSEPITGITYVPI
jgi:hypothetical protein